MLERPPYTPEQQARHDEMEARLAGLPLTPDMIEYQAHHEAMGYERAPLTQRKARRNPAPDDAEREEPSFPLPLDLDRLAGAPIPPRIHRVGQIMPIGTIGLISAHGGMGKSQLALDLCIAVASGGAFMGMDTLPAVAAMLTEEDDERDMHFRVAAQCRHRGISMAEVGNRLFIYPATDKSGAPLVTADRDGIVGPTSRYMSLRAEILRRNIALLVLDNLAALCNVKLNDPGQATQSLALLGQLALEDGNVALIAHVDKASAKAGYGSEGYSGTAAWHNRARWRWYLFSPNRADDADPDCPEEAKDDGRRVLEVQKVNAGVWGQRIALRIGADGVIGLDGVGDGIVASIRANTDRRWLLSAIAQAEDAADPIHSAERANRNAHRRLAVFEGFPSAYRGQRGKRALFGLLLRLKAEGAIAEANVPTANRKTATVWHLTDVGRASLEAG